MMLGHVFSAVEGSKSGSVHRTATSYSPGEPFDPAELSRKEWELTYEWDEVSIPVVVALVHQAS